MRFSILLTLLSLSFLPSALADDGKVSFGNEMDSIVEAVFCVDQRGRTKEIAGPVGMKSSVFIVAELLEADCERLALRMDDGRGWQFYFEPATNTAKEIALSWESVVPVSNAEYPSLFLNFGKDVFTAPAGVPLFNVIQLLRFGMDKDKWQESAMPEPVNHGDLKAFAVSFANISWSLTGEGIRYAELVKGMQLAEKLTLTAYYSNTMLETAFANLKEAKCKPVLFAYDGMDAAGAEGAAVWEGEISTLMQAASVELRWEALESLMRQAAERDGKMIRMAFDNGDFLFDLELDRDEAVALLKVTRKAEVPFGN